MLKLNEKGQAIIFFVLLIPMLVLFLVGTVELSKQVYFKIRMQETLNRAVYAGASYLTESLNQIALLNRKAHQLFLERKADFQKRGMKKNKKEAKRQLKETMRQQELLLEKMEQLAQNAYAKAYQISDDVIKQEFSEARFVPLYQSPISLLEGLYEEISFAHVKGKTFDPKGYKKIPKDGYYLRMAFEKDQSQTAAMAALLELAPPKSILPSFIGKRKFQAVAAAQPFGGSLWHYATDKTERDFLLYRTSMIPTENLYEE